MRACITSTIAWEGDPVFGGRPGLWREYEGGYEDWKVQRARGKVLAAAALAATAAAASTVVAKAAQTAPKAAPAKVKLSYKEQRELEALPARIEALETEQTTLNQRLASATVYADEADQVPVMHARIEAIEGELMAALERWEALSAR